MSLNGAPPADDNGGRASSTAARPAGRLVLAAEHQGGDRDGCAAATPPGAADRRPLAGVGETMGAAADLLNSERAASLEAGCQGEDGAATLFPVVVGGLADVGGRGDPTAEDGPPPASVGDGRTDAGGGQTIGTTAVLLSSAIAVGVGGREGGGGSADSQHVGSGDLAAAGGRRDQGDDDTATRPVVGHWLPLADVAAPTGGSVPSPSLLVGEGVATGAQGDFDGHGAVLPGSVVGVAGAGARRRGVDCADVGATTAEVRDSNTPLAAPSGAGCVPGCAGVESRLRLVVPLPMVRKLRMHMDSCPGTNKSQFFFGGLGLMLASGLLDCAMAVYMVVGHTKFGPDLVARQIAGRCNVEDVFNHGQLSSVIASYGTSGAYDDTLLQTRKLGTQQLFNPDCLYSVLQVHFTAGGRWPRDPW